MDGRAWLAKQFEATEPARGPWPNRMLGSRSDADDAVQEFRLLPKRSDPAGVNNLGGWLTTAVARVCLVMLRSRSHRVRSTWRSRTRAYCESRGWN